MHLTYVIVDDFLPDPDAVRREALRLDYPPRPERATYPGRNASRTIALRGIEHIISQTVFEPLIPQENSSHCLPRLALAGDKATVSVHADFCHWSGIIFLTPDEHCRGGTHFFRHKATGWDRAPVFPGEAEKAGFANADAAMQAILGKGSRDRSQWDEIMTIPMKFNRLALFRGYLWHDAGESFGTAPENGRLILPLFFENTAPR